MTWQPTASVEIIAGTPAGGGQDRAARAPALHLATSVTNTPGRGGGKGWDELAARGGDPHVVSISSATVITNRIGGVASTDDTHLTPLADLCTEYLVFAVASESPIASPLQLAEAILDAEATRQFLAAELVKLTGALSDLGLIDG